DEPEQTPSGAASRTKAQEAAVGPYSLTAEQTREVQRALTTLGLFSGELDGDYGRETVEGVRRFQESSGLVADGRAGPQTLEQLPGAAARAGRVDVEQKMAPQAEPAAAEPLETPVAVGSIAFLCAKEDVEPLGSVFAALRDLTGDFEPRIITPEEFANPSN